MGADAHGRKGGPGGQRVDWRLAVAVCDRLLQQNPMLAPMYGRRAFFRLGCGDHWGCCADLLRFGLYAALQSGEREDYGGLVSGRGKQVDAEREGGGPRTRMSWAACGNQAGFGICSK